MTNFNGINPLANMLKFLNNVKQNDTNNQNQQPAQNAQLQNPANANQSHLQNLSNNVFSSTPTNYLNSPQPDKAQQTQNNAIQEALKMENEVVQKYLQNILNMPESFDKFLQKANLKQTNMEGYQFLKLFVENMLNNKELSQLLNQNSKEAVQKLLNVIAQSFKHTNVDSAQLKELLSVLNTITSSSSNNVNSLRELFLLYIPISYQVYKESGNFSKISEENEEKIKNSTLSILFETYNFSNILVLLNEENNKILIEIHTTKDFPNEKFQKTIESISKEQSLNSVCSFVSIKESKVESQKQNFKIISDNYVSIKVLQICYSIIKIIFKFDNELKESLEM